MVKRRREEADSDDGAIVVAVPEARHRTVYIDTNLDTHLAVMVSSTDTVSYIKREILVEHLDAFPHMGEIKIHSVQVKRKGNFYHLPDSMPIATVFEGIKRDWFIHVIGSVSVDQALNGACNDHIGSLHTKSYDQNVPYDSSIDLRMDSEHVKDEHCRYLPSDTCRSSAYKNIVSIAQVKAVSNGLKDHNSGDSSKEKPVTKRRKLKHKGGDDGSQKFQMSGNETSAKANDRKSKLSLMPSDDTQSGRDDVKRPQKKSKKIRVKDQFETAKSEKIMANVEADGDKMNENDERISRTTNESILENNEADLTNKGGRDDDKRSRKKKSKKIRANDQFETKKREKMMANVDADGDKMNVNDEGISWTNNKSILENNEAVLGNKGETDHDKRPKKKKSKKISVKDPFEPNTGNNDQTLVPKFSEPVTDNTAKIEHFKPHSQTCQTIKALVEKPSEKHLDMHSASHISLVPDMADLNSEQPETVHKAQLSDANATEKHGSPAGKKRKSKKSRTTYQDSFTIDPSDVSSGLPTVDHLTDGSNNQKLSHCIEIENPSNKQPIDTSAASSRVVIDKDTVSEAGLLRPNSGFNEQDILTGTCHLEQPETVYNAKLCDANATEKHGSPPGTKKKRKSKKSLTTNQNSFSMDPSDVPSGLPSADRFTDGCDNQNLSHCMEVENPSNKKPIDTSAASSRIKIDKVNESEACHLTANDRFNKQDIQTGTSHLEQPETVYKEVLRKRTSQTNSESILENNEADITNKGVTEHDKRLKKKKSEKINVKDPLEPNTGNTDPSRVPTFSEPVTDNTAKVEHMRPHSQTVQTIKPFEEEPSEKHVDMQSASHNSLILEMADVNSEQPETVYKAPLSDANATEKHGSPAGSKKKRKSKKSRTNNRDSSTMDSSDVPSGLPTADHLPDGSNNLSILNCMEVELSSNKQPIDISAASSPMEIDKVTESEAGHLRSNNGLSERDIQTGTSLLDAENKDKKGNRKSKRNNNTAGESLAISAKSDHEVCAEKMVLSNDKTLGVDHPPNVAEVSGTAMDDHIPQVSVADLELPESDANSGQACGNLEGNREMVLQGEVSCTEDGKGINFRRYFVPSSQQTKGAFDKVEKTVTLSMDTTSTGERSANDTVPSIPGGLGNTPAHDENLNDENNRSSGFTELGKAKYDKHEKVKLHSNKKSPKISETDINGSNTFHQAEKPIGSKTGDFASVSENKITLDESSSTQIGSQMFKGSIKDSSQPHSNHRSLASQKDARKTTEVNPTHTVAPKDKISHHDFKNENGDGHSKFPTQTPSSDSSSSSVDGSESSHHSTKSGLDGVKENNSHGESNLKSSLSGVKNLSMDAIFRSSKRFKVAKQKAAEQLESDPESQPILVQSVKDNNSIGESNLKSSLSGAQNSTMHVNLRRSNRFKVAT
ncbi:unnamed protein product [Cuscuta epithymum]|uniref:Uncharacterized protein n=1 Tax=Cuscuta epithymum TaxID=186058 RepID=A0AAV0EAI5_9ASTE|nr:unnamed protein product [Cuscuta epithymum]